MIEVQVINKMLQNDNLDVFTQNGVNASYFYTYKEEFNFIADHYKKYNKVPDRMTFIREFPEFKIFDVLEPDKFLIEEIKEEWLYNKGVKLFQESAELLEENSFEGMQHIMTKAEKLLEASVFREGTDISKMKETKLNDIEEKKSKKGGLLGIPSGLPELDEILGGWLNGEELVTIVGRVNQGKSWLLLKFLAEAQKQNKKVLLYSGEMSALQVAYRVDTMKENFSNRGFMRGTINDEELSRYKDYLEENQAPFIVITPTDLGGRRLTISMLRGLIKKYKPDVIGIDQISLMEDERGKGEQRRVQFTHLAEDLFNLSEEFKVPVLADAQANRNTATKKDENPENPGLDDVGESDGIGQNSSRLISLVQTPAGLSLFIAKNRYGENNKKLLYVWDIDRGTFRYTSAGDSVTELTPRNNSNKETNPTDVF